VRRQTYDYLPSRRVSLPATPARLSETSHFVKEDNLHNVVPGGDAVAPGGAFYEADFTDAAASAAAAAVMS